MDYNKIGNFIMTERKKKKLTQAKLAEKLFVSEKTVSKWEKGNGIPETSLLPKLCEILDVGINELLSGEKNEEIDKQNNQLLFNMAKEVEQKNKVIWRSMWVILTVSMIGLFAGIFLTAFFMPEGVWQIITVIGLCVIFLPPCFYALKLETSVGSYKCKNCGCEFIPSYKEVVVAMHMGTTRYLKCPKCHKRTWSKKVIKK